MILGILRQFGGYTYSSLMEEDAEVLRLLMIEQMGTPQQSEGGGDQWPTM